MHTPAWQYAVYSAINSAMILFILILPGHIFSNTTGIYIMNSSKYDAILMILSQSMWHLLFNDVYLESNQLLASLLNGCVGFMALQHKMVI